MNTWCYSLACLGLRFVDMAQRAATLAQTSFPLYTIRMIGEKHFMVAGGGGSARTGIVNAMETFELKKNSEGKCVAKRISHFETEDSAVMNSAVSQMGNDRRYYVATGQDDQCQLYAFQKKSVALKPHDMDLYNNSPALRRRKNNFSVSEAYNNAVNATVFDIEKKQAVRTDFSREGPFQKCVMFSPDLRTLITGGADGYIRVWQHPGLEKVCEVKAHTNEIDDLDISPDNHSICTVSKDNTASIWNAHDGLKKMDLLWDYIRNGKYRMRACRFGRVEGEPNGYNLFTTHVPIVRGSRSAQCYLTKWNTSCYRPMIVKKTGAEALSALSVSSDGTFLGLGTLSGSISVYTSSNLQRLYHVKEAHDIFVTGLEFTPSTQPALKATGDDNDFTLLSISADNQVKIHQEPPKTIYSPIFAVLGFIIMVYLLLWIVSALF